MDDVFAICIANRRGTVKKKKQHGSLSPNAVKIITDLNQALGQASL
jgi:hypothetical protein